MQIMIHNPSFPKDKSKAVALSKAQFDVVHDYIVECMNKRKKIAEAVIVQKLTDAGQPLVFA